MDGAGFLTIQLLVHKGREEEGHKSCLLVHIQVNTAHYHHRLKPVLVHPEGFGSFPPNRRVILDERQHLNK